ncbi:AAA domain-containing protein [Xylaria palmicola]|nr:AAA domain-containing protein [Xylaria palmicola]
MAAPVLPSIYIVGCQCTGKTTLADAIFEHVEQHPVAPGCPPGMIKEVARTVLKNHGFTRSDIRSSQHRALELQSRIIEAQSEAERAQLAARAWFISDRSAVDPVIYARRYASREAADALMASPAWVAMRARMAASLVIVCEPGVDWLADDGVRLMPLDAAEWLQLHAEFCALLADVGLEHYVLPSRMGNKDERVQFVLASWEEKRGRLTISRGEDGVVPN